MIKILIAEDDTLFAQTLEDFLTEEGFMVDLCYNGSEAEERCYERHYHLLLLDINMPGLNGLELLKSLRESADTTPAIYLTSYQDKETLLEGYSRGADDFLKKPVDLDELLMRINALIRRSYNLEERVTIGDFTYDMRQKYLFRGEQRIPLSKKLHTLLEILLAKKGEIVSREEIKSTLWEWDESPSDGSLRVYINELKKVLGKERIENIKGIGYRLAC